MPWTFRLACRGTTIDVTVERLVLSQPLHLLENKRAVGLGRLLLLACGPAFGALKGGASKPLLIFFIQGPLLLLVGV